MPTQGLTLALAPLPNLFRPGIVTYMPFSDNLIVDTESSRRCSAAAGNSVVYVLAIHGGDEL